MMDIKLDDDRIGQAPPRPPVVLRMLGAIGALVAVGLFGAIAAIALVGADLETLRRAVGELWPSALHDYGKVYAALAIPGIPANDYDSSVATNLSKLEAEPCDRTAMSDLSTALVRKKDAALAAQANLGFSQSCHGNEYAEREAGRLFYAVGNYPNARAMFSDLVDRFPQNNADWYAKARSEAALGLHDAALQSYANAIALSQDQAAIREGAFTDMAALYAAGGRFCEAMAPIEAYVAIRPQDRDTPRTRQLIAGYSQRGHCTLFASGSDSFPTLGAGVIRVRATVNGTTGTFLVDTGASFVAVTDSFAAKAGLKTDDARTGRAITANGDTQIRLTTALSVRLGRVQAGNVAAVVIGKSLGTADGLLGRSFLSRFDMTIAGDRLTLRAKS